MKKTQTLLLLFFCLQSLIFASSDLKPFKKTVFEITSAPDTIVLGSAFQLEYELTSPFENISEITFSQNVPGFGIPQLLKDPSISNVTTTDDNGNRSYDYSGNYIYGVVPTASGNLTIPQATILVNGKPYKAEPRKIVVLPSKNPLRQVKARLQFPSNIKKDEDFILKVIIEGDCEDVNQFTVYLPIVSWADQKDNSYGGDSKPYKEQITNNKHEYQYRMTAKEAGSYSFPNTIVWIPRDETHFLADNVAEVNIADNDANPLDVTVKAVMPDSIVEGVPFCFYYLLKGEVNNVNEYKFESEYVEGLDTLAMPISQFVNSSIHYSQTNSYEYSMITETAYVCESRAHRSGQFTIPAFSVMVDGKRFSVDPVTINVLPSSEKTKIDVQIKQSVPERVLFPKSFWYETVVTTYSGLFNDIEINRNEVEKQVSKNFIILDYVINDSRSSSSNRFNEPYIKSTRTYKWKLKAQKTGEFTLPELKLVVNNDDFIQKNHSIVIASKPDKNDVDVTFDSIVVSGSEFKIDLELKNSSWRIIDDEISPLSAYGFKEAETGLSVIKRSNRSSFALIPLKEGRLMIPPIILKTDNGDILVDSLFINILPIDKYPIKSTSKEILDEDIYITSKTNKTKVYPNEPIIVTEKLYTRLPLTRRKSPEYSTLNLTDFHPDKNNIFNAGGSINEMDKGLKKEHINGRNYNTYVLREIMLFPSEVGFPSLFNSVFSFFLKMEDTNKKNIEVKWESGEIIYDRFEVIPFPKEGKPQSFDGLVGDFSIKAELNKTKVKQTDSLTLLVEIEGVGSGNLLASKKLDVKINGLKVENIDDNNAIYTNISEDGLEATGKYRYKIDTSVKGRYSIPSIELSYFDCKQKKYVIKKTNTISFTIN